MACYMKRLITIFLITATSLGAFAQSMGIRFNDRQGREFVVYAPSGQFSYSLYEGDYITRDYEGRVTCVGNTYISYNYYDQVSCIGDIYISYDSYGRVVQVGGLFLSYDYNGSITNTSGRVRNNSSGGQNSGYYIKQSTVRRNW